MDIGEVEGSIVYSFGFVGECCLTIDFSFVRLCFDFHRPLFLRESFLTLQGYGTLRRGTRRFSDPAQTALMNLN
jgi:hypothetical protein